MDITFLKVLLVGEYKGKKIQDVKKRIQEDLIKVYMYIFSLLYVIKKYLSIF